MALRVVVADADPIFVDRIAVALSEDPQFVLVGSASSAEQAIALVDSELPDLVFVALDMPGASKAARHVLRRSPNPPRVVALTPGVGARAEQRVLPPGVSAYVTKTEDGAEIAALVAALCELKARSAAQTSP